MRVLRYLDGLEKISKETKMTFFGKGLTDAAEGMFGSVVPASGPEPIAYPGYDGIKEKLMKLHAEGVTPENLEKALDDMLKDATPGTKT